jgi:hypothetical protein
VSEALEFPLPPLSAPVPEPDDVAALRAKVAEQDRVIALAKTRVETLGAEKFEALERVRHLEAREAELLERIASLESPRTPDEKTLAELLDRVAALEAIVVPSPSSQTAIRQTPETPPQHAGSATEPAHTAQASDPLRSPAA